MKVNWLQVADTKRVSDNEMIDQILVAIKEAGWKSPEEVEDVKREVGEIPDKLELIFEKDFETRGFIRFREQGDSPKIDILHMKRVIFHQLGSPNRLKMTIEKD